MANSRAKAVACAFEAADLCHNRRLCVQAIASRVFRAALGATVRPFEFRKRCHKAASGFVILDETLRMLLRCPGKAAARMPFQPPPHCPGKAAARVSDDAKLGGMDLRRTWTNGVEALFALYEQKMYAVAFAILHDQGQAEDAVMAAFEKILKTQGVPRDPASSSAKQLVFMAIRQTAIDQYRRNAREQRLSAPSLDARQDATEAYAPGHNPIDDHLRQLEANRMVDSLPPSYGEVLRERFLNDRSVRQTAQQLGISESSVRKRQERGLKILRKKKGGSEYEPLAG